MKMIVAYDGMNLGIGKDNQLLFHIPDDMKRFKKLTEEAGTVVMGRKTFESIGSKPLKNRTNIVLTSNPLKNIYDGKTILLYFASVASVLNYLKQTDTFNRTFVIGGQKVYEQFLPFCNEAYCTAVFNLDNDIEPDAYFPQLKEEDGWVSISLSDMFNYTDKEGNRFAYNFDHCINTTRLSDTDKFNIMVDLLKRKIPHEEILNFFNLGGNTNA